MGDLIYHMTPLERVVSERGIKAIKGGYKPWTLREWRPQVEGVLSTGARNLEDVASSLRRTDVRGPAAAKMLENVASGTTGNILNLANQFEQVPEQYVSQALKSEQGASDRANAAWAALAQMSTAKRAAKAAGGGFCCFMFIISESEIIDQVQKYKYENFGYNSYVANGYRWMSLKIMPLVRNNKFFKKLIKFCIVKPLSGFAIYYYKKDRRALLYAPFGIFWCGLWELIGRITKYNSVPYQKMIKAIFG